MEVIQPLFDRLGSAEFLASCEETKTQNLNEAYHHVIWSLAPKTEYNSALEIKLAVGLGTLFFNKGRNESFRRVLSQLNHTITPNMQEQWKTIDSCRARYARNNRRPERMKRRKELKRRNIKTVQAFTHAEGTQYESGKFHAGNQSAPGAKKQRRTTTTNNKSAPAAKKQQRRRTPGK